jgi:hypothetical protein
MRQAKGHPQYGPRNPARRGHDLAIARALAPHHRWSKDAGSGHASPPGTWAQPSWHWLLSLRDSTRLYPPDSSLGAPSRGDCQFGRDPARAQFGLCSSASVQHAVPQLGKWRCQRTGVLATEAFVSTACQAEALDHGRRAPRSQPPTGGPRGRAASRRQEWAWSGLQLGGSVRKRARHSGDGRGEATRTC